MPHQPDSKDVKRGDRVRTTAGGGTFDGTVVSVIVGTRPRLAIVWDGTLTRLYKSGDKCNIGLIDEGSVVMSINGNLFRVLT